MPETVFSRIIRKEIPADIVYEDEQVLAFRDINPQAPVHVLVIPKTALPSVADARAEHGALLGHLVLRAAEIARTLGLDATGYRLVVNHGKDAGQAVAHLHVHILGGRALGWPPG
jgi:histidine triad (HIT) family protein